MAVLDLLTLTAKVLGLEASVSAGDSKNTTQDTRLTSVETKNTAQDARLTALETGRTQDQAKVAALEQRVAALEAKLAQMPTGGGGTDGMWAAITAMSQQIGDLDRPRRRRCWHGSDTSSSTSVTRRF